AHFSLSCVSVDSLTCNKCTFGLIGFCLNSAEETCTSNTTLSSFSGFNTQGCKDNSTGCNMTTSAVLLGVTYETKLECCSTDKCNPITLSGAPSTRMTLTAAIGAAVLASAWGSML
uniref:UPAR/Ly6 domain-containing protein n=1 Tax=Lates calcarifer TaxID=8187 RepID=A0A4W6E3U3_LATCA